MTNQTSTQTVYNILKSFEENVVYGPHWEGPLPTVPTTTATKTFLGHRVNSLFGVSASPMTFGSRNCAFFSKLGYDILTYRSVRSIEWHGVSYPQWRYVDAPVSLSTKDLGTTLTAHDNPIADQSVSMANSFGIQSLAPAYWQPDVEKAKASLLPGQVLILSLMITPESGRTVAEDAREVARLAAATSAEVFEINLACPNSGKASLVYEDLETSLAVCTAAKAELGDRPLLAKVGYYQDPQTLSAFLEQSRGIIAGISSTNTYSMSITDQAGEVVFPGRPTAGVSGNAVRQLSQQQAAAIVALKHTLNLPELVVIGIGGVMTPAHIEEYLALGVDAVQSAVGVYADPLLAINYKKTLETSP